MAVNDTENTVLVDPELLVPNMQYAAEEAFWERFGKAIPKDSTLLAIGETTHTQCLNFYVAAFYDQSSTITMFPSNHDVGNLYLRALKLPVASGVVSDGDFRIESAVYQPLYGDDETIATLELDLESAKHRRLYTDMDSWNGADSSETQTLGNVTLINWVAGETGCARAILRENINYKCLQDMAAVAFPKLRFSDGSWDSLRKLNSNELEYAPIIAKYLGALNDWALEVWKRNVEPYKCEYDMGALGVNCSIEDTGTMQTLRLRKMRTYSYNGEELVMTWHAKIRPQTGRMYFFVDVNCEYDSQCYIYVGHFTDHYPTLKKPRKS